MVCMSGRTLFSPNLFPCQFFYFSRPGAWRASYTRLPASVWARARLSPARALTLSLCLSLSLSTTLSTEEGGMGTRPIDLVSVNVETPRSEQQMVAAAVGRPNHEEWLYGTTILWPNVISDQLSSPEGKAQVCRHQALPLLLHRRKVRS